MTDLSQKGIYIIFNIIDGKFYVGSSAKSFKNRWIRHKSHLNRIRHMNPHLQSAWCKYGEGNFEFRIIELVENLENILKREQYWLDELQAVKYGYNILPIAGNSAGLKHTEETKAKLSAIAKSRTEEQRTKKDRASRIALCKYVYEITTPVGEIDICISYRQYAKDNGLSHGSLGHVLSGFYKSHKGYTIRKIGIITGWVDGKYTWEPVDLIALV